MPSGASEAAARPAADDTVVAEVADLSHDGRGVAEVDGRAVFVAGALPAERVRIRTRKRRRRYHEAELVEIVEPSADRVEPPCPYFGVCGGCALQHLEYRAQVRFKQQVVAEALGRIGRLEPPAFEPAITGAQWHYRRRARLGIKHVAGKGRVLVGFRERAAPLVTDMQDCRILAPPMDRLPAILAGLVARTSISDRIPQAEIAVGDDAGAVVLRVLEQPTPADIDLLAGLNEQLDVDVYLQTGGPDTIAPVGRPPRELHYSLEPDGLRIVFEPGDFVQINAEVNRAMVAAAIEAADLTASDRVLDLYCGLGNFSLPIARRVAEVTGVDGAAPLIARAGANARRNGIGNASFLAADLSVPGWPFLKQPHDVVFLDPARAGAEAAVAAVPDMQPRRIVYVSCHPGTLARDAGELVHRHGYRLTSVRALDMFPNTHHVEAIAVFDRD
jgi:23S rRNA (uracil1939-C5)-methyltransferase